MVYHCVFHSDSLFANHLALNGSFTLIKAVIAESHKGEEQKKWLSKMDMDSATKIVQKLLLTDRDTVINPEFSPVYRRYHSPSICPMIKPSSSDHTTAFIQGDKILVKAPNLPEKLYNYNLKDVDKTQAISDDGLQQSLSQKLLAYIQVAMDLLLHCKAGHE
jgi:hypothetical protein